MQGLMAAVAAVVGILMGFWLRSQWARKEQSQLEVLLQDRVAELAATRTDLTTARNELFQAQALAASRAGFEALSSEREKTIATVTAERDKTIAALTAERDRAVMTLTAERDHARGEAQMRAESEKKLSTLVTQLDTALRNERDSLAEKVALLEDAKKALADQFQALAGQVLEQKARTFTESSQKDLGTLLNPLKIQIEDFRKKVEEAQSDSKTGVARLEGLIGSLGSLNQQLAAEARNLTTALRGSAKAQGDWGEFILRDLLDKAGLREGEEYNFQQSHTGVENADGERSRSVRTDVILYLPGGRHLVVDSKVSLTAYTDCVKAENEEDRKAALRLHMASVRGHIAGLAKAGYHRLDGVETPDFVVMFVPVEPAFLIALQNDESLWSDAYKLGILLVGPTTLLYVIRIVNVLWQQERQARNVKDVMERGAELYDKFVGFVSDMESLGENLRRTDANYSSAMKRLSEGRGNLIRQVEMLRQLGVRPGKTMPVRLLEQAGVEESLSLAAEADPGDAEPAE